jgi:hypothetical protein
MESKWQHNIERIRDTRIFKFIVTLKTLKVLNMTLDQALNETSKVSASQ